MELIEKNKNKTYSSRTSEYNRRRSDKLSLDEH